MQSQLRTTCTGLRSEDDAAARFARIAYEPSDWIAVFLKSYESGRVIQRVGPVERLEAEPLRRWLCSMNARGFNIYVTVNSLRPGRRSRTRESVASIRHVFVDADVEGDAVLASVRARSDLPPVSYVLHSSPGRVHLFWRARDFDASYIECLQKRLAAELRTDLAATPTTQMTRLPGFVNHKRERPYLVTIDYFDIKRRFEPADFPFAPSIMSEPLLPRSVTTTRRLYAIERARRYLASVPPAVSGQHGDVHTFKVCCRLIRGFALEDDQALRLLEEWNERCLPPWTTAELVDKLRRAARYGREPIGGLL